MDRLYTASLGLNVPSVGQNMLSDLAVALRVASGTGVATQDSGLEARIFQATSDLAAGTLVQVDENVVEAVDVISDPATVTTAAFDWSDREVFGIFRGFSGASQYPGGANDYQFDAAGAPLGDAFLINENTAGNQDQPKVTALSTGGFVVAWEAGDDWGRGFYIQQYDAAGSKVDGPQRVSQNATSDQSYGDVEGLPGGRFVVAWSATNEDAAGSWGIYQNVYGAAGSVLPSQAPELSNVVTRLGFQENSLGTPQLIDTAIGLFDAEAQPPLEVKGLDQPLPTWIVRGVLDGPAGAAQRGVGRALLVGAQAGDDAHALGVGLVAQAVHHGAARHFRHVGRGHVHEVGLAVDQFGR